MPTDPRGPQFELTPDALEHPAFLKLKKGLRYKLIQLAVWSRQFCSLGVLTLYDDEIAVKLGMALDDWESARDTLLLRGCLFAVRTEKGNRRYEFALWFIPRYDGDKRQEQDWEQDVQPADTLTSTGKNAGRRKYEDNAEKQAFWRACQEARKDGTAVPDLYEWRRTRTDYPESETQRDTDRANPAQESERIGLAGTSQSTVPNPKAEELPARVTVNAQKNGDSDRNSNTPESPLSLDLSLTSVAFSSHTYLEQLLLISDWCVTRYGENPQKEDVDRNAPEIIEMMQRVGIAEKTIREELLVKPDIGLALCVRQLIYLPYHDAAKPAGFFCKACRVHMEAPGKFHAEMERRRQAAAQEAVRQQQEQQSQTAQHDDDILRFRLDRELASLAYAERQALASQAEEATIQENPVFGQRLRSGKRDHIITDAIQRHTDRLLQGRIQARSAERGVEYAPPDLTLTEEPTGEIHVERAD